ncbi:leucine-rich repeat-containing protein 74B-like isoform X1 [Dreissena polymorpha]|uniref:leucine-rich repeat-containing protein 74B-like isoform X1 n=2 Tax=Dreissena polymorpha TaxID=45954 RepID=UPI0022652B17|nr:leucine-rich repeat-containing protein 74B-like isoform X1 [Dreissena polymorpha]
MTSVGIGTERQVLRMDDESSSGTATPKDFRRFQPDSRENTDISLLGEPQTSFLESVQEEYLLERSEESHQGKRVQIDIMDDSGRRSEIIEGDRAPSVSRMPSTMTRAMLVRTPANKDGSGDSRSPEVSDDERVPHEPDILITELKEQELVEGDADPDEGSDIEQEYRQVTIETVEADEDWDTDLEIEDEVMKEVRNHDPTGRSYYEKVCSRMGLVPVSYLKRHITDHEITMRFHGLGASAAKAIALVLRDNITLEKLNLQGNWIEGEGGLAMARMLEENDYITELVLSDNRLGSVGAECMCKMLSVNAGLRVLDLSGNNFQDKDAVIFADCLTEHAKYLKELHLSRNQFGTEAGEILGPAISSNDILEVLDLSWNHIRGKGAIAVAKGIGENVRLKSCNISWNGFGPEGGAAVGEAMASNSSLLELDVSGNRLNAETAVKMSRLISSNDTIRVLRMGNNLLTTSGAIVLATSINNAQSSELEELDITDVPVEFEFLRIFEDIKMKRPNFKLTHGPIISSGNTKDDLNKPAVHPHKRKEPVLILDQHIVVNDMRLLDILKRYDPDGGYTVSPEDFVRAVEDLAVPFNKPKLEAACKRLADDQAGRIYFGDFIKQQEDQLKTNGGDHDEREENRYEQ